MDGRSCYSAGDDEERAREAVRSILPPDDDSQEVQLPTQQGVDAEEHLSPAHSTESESDKNVTGAKHKIAQEPEDEDEVKAKSNKEYDSPRFYRDHERANESLPSTSLHTELKSVNSPSKASTSHSAPTDEGTLCKVVAEHYNNVPETGLEERSKSRILYLRNFNNWIKSMLIDEFVTKVRESKPRGSNLKVLDMGCGKGGDLFKWRQGKITHLVASDIAATSVEQCKERYNDMKQRTQRERNFNPIFSAEFIVANCTKERLREQYQDVTMQLDLVSCQFAFHYCFESLPQAECMMRNAAECLRPGGYFFGTCPNANAIISRARKAGGKQFGNDVYSVEFETPVDDIEPPPFFGAKYNFHMEGVVDCPEFLVHFPTFIRLAEKFDLKFLVCEPFHSFFERCKEKGRGLLGRMQALETFPPFPDQSLLGPISQYQHADDFLKKNVSSQRLGTLSEAEWDAANLYLIFVFEKASTR